MARLLKCPTCGHDISENAKSCPNCGEPLFKGRIVGNEGKAPVWLLPASIFQFIVFWAYPLYALFNISFGIYTPNAFLWFYGIYSLVAILMLLRAAKTAKRSYACWGVSVATAVISSINTVGGIIMVFINSNMVMNQM